MSVELIRADFETQRRDVVPYHGTRLASYAPEVLDRELLVEVDGRILTRRDIARRAVRDGARIVIADLPHGIEVASIVALTALVGEVVSAISIPTLVAVAAVGIAGTVGAIVGLGYLSAALSAPNVPSIDVRKPGEVESPTRRFDGVQTSAGSGLPLALVYGEHRVGGHILESFIDPHFDLISTDSEWIANAKTDREDGEPDALNTRLALAWGPIDGVSDVRIDENPLDNFAGSQADRLLGTIDQSVPIGFAESKTAISIQTLVSVSGGAVDRFVPSDLTDQPITRFEIQLLFHNGLFELVDGNVLEREVTLKVEYRTRDETSGLGTGSWVALDNLIASGATLSQEPFWIQGPTVPSGYYEVRLTRVTADVTNSATLRDEFRWETAQGVHGSSRAHPGVAQLALRQIPQQQSRVPRSYDCLVRGFCNVRQYSDTSTYAEAYSSNPAWCAAHFITSKIHGAGRFYTYDDLDLPFFISWANHCDELVDDGRGGLEKRAIVGLAIDTETPLEVALSFFTAGSDAVLVEKGGTWSGWLEKEKARTWRITESSYRKDSLTSAYVETSSRPLRLTGRFVNSEADYRLDALPQEDQSQDAGTVLHDGTLNYFGTTRPSQVARQLVKAVRANRLMDRVISVEVGLEGYLMSLGDRIAVESRTTGAGIAAGLVAAVSGDRLTVTLDDFVTLDSGKSYQLSVVHKTSGKITQKGITGPYDQKTSDVSVTAGTWEAEPAREDRWFIFETTASLDEYTVMGISRGQNLMAKITGIRYDETVFSGGIVSNEARGSEDFQFAPALIPQDVTGLTATTRTVSGMLFLQVSWRVPGGSGLSSAAGLVRSYNVYFRAQSKRRWRLSGTTRGDEWAIRGDIASGTTYDVAVVSVGQGGRRAAIQDAPTVSVTA